MYRYKGTTKSPRNCKKWTRFHKDNFFCAISHNKMYGPFIFGTVNVIGISYLDIEMENDINCFIYQHDRSPPHWHKEIRDYLNWQLPHRWICRCVRDKTSFSWPSKSPDLSLCDLFVWGKIKHFAYVPPLHITLAELRNSITTVFATIHTIMLRNVWSELNCHLDICLTAQGAYLTFLVWTLSSIPSV